MTKSDLALRLATRFPVLARGALRCWVRLHLWRTPQDGTRDPWFVAHLSEALAYRIPVWARLGNGMKIRVAWNDYIGRAIYQHGYYEPELVALLGRLLKPGMVFLDVGAHVGQYTLAASPLVGKSGGVHCFEPDPETYRWLCLNIQANHLANVVPNQMAVADQSGKKQFFFATSQDIGSNSLSRPSALHDSGRSTEVRCTTVDQYLLQRNIPHVDVMKIDIEGAELPMLAGATKLLHREDAPVILVEFEAERQKAFGNSCAALADALTDCGYQLFRAEGAMTEYHPSTSDPRSFNVLGIPKNAQRILAELKKATT
jgi:FkbM family methyltransferase